MFLSLQSAACRLRLALHWNRASCYAAQHNCIALPACSPVLVISSLQPSAVDATSPFRPPHMPPPAPTLPLPLLLPSEDEWADAYSWMLEDDPEEDSDDPQQQQADTDVLGTLVIWLAQAVPLSGWVNGWARVRGMRAGLSDAGERPQRSPRKRRALPRCACCASNSIQI